MSRTVATALGRLLHTRAVGQEQLDPQEAPVTHGDHSVVLSTSEEAAPSIGPGLSASDVPSFLPQSLEAAGVRAVCQPRAFLQRPRLYTIM